MSNCFHCGSKIPDGGEVIGLVDKVFCCYGCLSVAELITNSNLERYYEVRENNSNEKVRKLPQELWLAYDVEEVKNLYVRKLDDNFNEANLFIDGIHCSACSWLIKTALKQKLGLDKVIVNATTTRAELIFPQNIKLSQILTCIADLGYKPNLFNPAEDEIKQNKIRNSYLSRLIISGLGMMQVMMFATGLYTGSFFGIEKEYSQLLRWVSLILTTPIFLYTGYPFLKSAFLGIKYKQINMDIPIATALLLAFVASVINTILQRGEVYFDSVLMFIFFISISRFLEFLTRRRAKLNSLNFSKLLPEALEVLDITTKQLKFYPLTAIQKGQIVKILPSQTVAFDGIIFEGETRINEAMLTGEGEALFKQVGDPVLAGSQNLESPILIKVQTTGQETTLAGIERLISKAQQNQSPIYLKTQELAQKTITAILILAAAAWLLWLFINPSKSFDIALAVLVATCPCALSLAMPVVFTAAINKAHSLGIFIKSSESLEKLLKIKNLIFDKTGTLTEGNFVLKEAKFFNTEEKLAWQIAKSLEKNSPHPLAWALVNQCSYPELELQKIKVFNQGVVGEYKGIKYIIGSYNFVKEFNSKLEIKEGEESEVFLVNQKELLAQFNFADPVIKNLSKIIAELKNYNILIASGDKLNNVQKVAELAGIKKFYADLKPADKLNLLEHFKEPSLVIGDGINDAPLMSKAELAVSVKGANPMNQDTADIVLLSSGIELLPYLFKLAQKSQKIITQNLFWAATYNLLIIPLAVCGFLTPWIAALGMSLSSLVVVGNALRIRS